MRSVTVFARMLLCDPISKSVICSLFDSDLTRIPSNLPEWTINLYISSQFMNVSKSSFSHLPHLTTLS
jgi:hypothetical protein